MLFKFLSNTPSPKSARNSLSFLLILLFFSMFFFGGCFGAEEVSDSPHTQPDHLAAPSTMKNTNGETTFPFTLTDYLGRTVTIAQEPQRIVSLSPATTEILFALGVGEKIVGITAYDDYPPEQVATIPQVGDFQGPNMEAIAAQKPDLIFASRLSGKEQMEALEKSGFTVVILEATSFEQVPDSLDLTAKITNTQEKGRQMNEELRQQLAEIHEKVHALPKVKTFYLVDFIGNWTTGKGTYIDELITLAGGENIAGDQTGWIQYSMETLVQQNPAVIITAPHAGNPTEISQSPGFKNTDAVKNGQIFLVSDDNIISRPSYRLIQGLAEIARFLHPEAFS